MIDTGGIVVSDAEYIPSQILKQARSRARTGSPRHLPGGWPREITAADRELADMLRKTGQACHARGEQGRYGRERSSGARVLFARDSGYLSRFRPSTDWAWTICSITYRRDLPEEAPNAEEERRFASRSSDGPNAGKSTLLNALTGEERAIVSPVAGTTRDSVDEEVERDGTKFVFIDTAGIRRKGKTKLMAEKLSVVMARRNIRMADVVIVVMDASEGVLGLDATIAGYAHEGGRSVILCVNKWDLTTEGKREEFEENVRYHLKFLDYAPVIFLSAKIGTGVNRLFPLIRECYESANQRVTTGELNRFVESVRFEERKILYITQAGVRPPSFVLFTDKAGPLHFSDERYLVNQLRKRFGFVGTPIELKIRGRVRKKDRPALK